MDNFLESILRFFQDPPPDDWKYRDKGLLQRGAEGLTSLGGPREGSPYIMGSDPLYELVNSAKRRMLESNPIADPGPEQDVVYPQERISVDPLQQFSMPQEQTASPQEEPYTGYGSGDLARRVKARLQNLPFEPGPLLAAAGARKSGSDPYGLEGTQPTASDVGGSMHDRAQAAIASRIEQERLAKESGMQSDLDKILSAANDQQIEMGPMGQFMEGTVPLIQDYEKGIAIGGDPSRGSKDEIIARIRAQAAKMAGREGPSAGGGGFSQGTMTPEITQRLSERDAWAAQQPMRDAVWDIDVARQRGDTAGQDSAAGRLQSMQQQASIQSKQDAINSLLSKVTDKTGKIDPDTYQKLGMLGQYVPSSMVGKGKEQTLAEFDALIASGSETISQLAPQAVFDPSGETSNRVAAERKGIQLLTQLKQMIANGQMTAEEASATFQQAMMMDKYVQGWLAEKMMPQPGQLQQGE